MIENFALARLDTHLWFLSFLYNSSFGVLRVVWEGLWVFAGCLRGFVGLCFQTQYQTQYSAMLLGLVLTLESCAGGIQPFPSWVRHDRLPVFCKVHTRAASQPGPAYMEASVCRGIKVGLRAEAIVRHFTSLESGSMLHLDIPWRVFF